MLKDMRGLYIRVVDLAKDNISGVYSDLALCRKYDVGKKGCKGLFIWKDLFGENDAVRKCCV